jgi:predicted acylesterase/phospholipase RssA
VAALLAAGCEPDTLLAKLRALDFNKLLRPVEKTVFPKESKLLLMLKAIPVRRRLLCSVSSIARWGGLYSSKGIECWVEECLIEFLGNKNRPIQFHDLLLPLHVVAGDLATMRARVSSSETTPNASVAHAVRCSCTVPLFFQPVEEGTMLLVDGGLVSNAPAFVFSRAKHKQRDAEQRTLLFTLQAAHAASPPADLDDLLGQLVTLSIDGSTDVQLTLTPDVARIPIPTGRIKATDFDKMNAEKVETLIESGRLATEEFIRNELLAVSNAVEPRRLNDEQEAFLRVTEQIYSAKSEVIVSSRDTKWFWEIFPTIYFWRKSGVRVAAFMLPLDENSPDFAKEKQRRAFMAGIGVDLVPTSSLPFTGFLIDGTGNPSSAAIIHSTNPSDYEPFAQFYTGRTDQGVLIPLYRHVHSLVPGQRECPDAAPLEPADHYEFINRLRKNIPVYRDPRVRIEFAEVQIKSIYLISRFVRACRYQQIGTLIDAYRVAGLELFAAAKFRLTSGDYSFVTPPVFERSGSNFVAIEGNTRSLHCANNNVAKICAIVVDNVSAPLPGTPIPLKQARITSWKRPPDERIKDFNPNFFRDIERAIRPTEMSPS